MSEVVGIGLTDGFLTVLERSSDGLHLSSVGMDPRGEAALTDDNTGAGPRTDPETYGVVDEIIVLPDPIDLETDGDAFTPRGVPFDADGNFVPDTITWSRDPAAAAGSNCELEETAVSSAHFAQYQGPNHGTIGYGEVFSFSKTFKARERRYVQFDLDIVIDSAPNQSHLMVDMDLQTGTILGSLDSTGQPGWFFKFASGPTLTSAAGGYYTLAFTFQIDSDELPEDDGLGGGFNNLYIASVFEEHWYVSLSTGSGFGGGDLNYLGVLGSGILLDPTFPTPLATTGVTHTPFSNAGASVNPTTGRITPGPDEEVFDLIATIGAVTGEVVVTIADP